MWMADVLILVIDVTHCAPLSPLYSYFIERIPAFLKANMVVVLTKADLLPLNSNNKAQDIHDTINKLIQQLYSELSIAGNSDILPFTTKDVAWGRDMLENIRKKVDSLARSAHQQLTVSANITQIAGIIQNIVADTELLVHNKREDHLFLFGEMLETYLSVDFEKDLVSWIGQSSVPTPNANRSTVINDLGTIVNSTINKGVSGIPTSELISVCFILMGNKIAGTVKQLASDFWIVGLIDDDLIKDLAALLEDNFQQMVASHAQKATRIRACHRTVYTSVGMYTSSLVWTLWHKCTIMAPASLLIPVLLSLLIPIAALRTCGVHKREWWQPSQDNNTTALIASILKDKRVEITRLCRKRVEKWLLTASRPEKIITDEIVSGIEQLQKVNFEL